jgi:hypothetical protein
LRFEHCTFANISFKGVTLNGDYFLDCAFIACYFRRATLSNSQFIGCKFIECNFSHVAIRGSDFRYSTFKDCYIPWDELEQNLPPEPNLRAELARNLSMEAFRLGATRDSRSFRICEIKSYESHLSAAIRGQSQWYRDHYDGWRRARAVVELFLSSINGMAWGYGQRVRVLVRNYLALGLLIFPLLFLFLSEGLMSKDGGKIGFIDTFYFSLRNILPTGIESGINATVASTRFLAGLESLVGLIMAGLFASYIFRWSMHR